MLGVDLSFQHFAEELAGLPGKYGKPYGRLYLAYHQTELAGCVALRPFDDTTCELKRLFIRPAFRGKRAGEKLVEKAIEAARLIGYTGMSLDTLPTLASAIHLYQKLGFHEIPAYYHNPLQEVLFFRLDL